MIDRPLADELIEEFFSDYNHVDIDFNNFPSFWDEINYSFNLDSFVKHHLESRFL